MASRKLSTVKVEQLCRMQAEAVLSVEAMAQKLAVATSVVERYLARPKVQRRAEQLSQEFRAAGQRLVRSRARWVVGRLIQMGSRDDEVGRKALVDLLKLALAQNPTEEPAGQGQDQEDSQAAQELTKHWTENEWNVVAKLLAGGGKQLPAAQTEK